eukprot:353972-Chlamydomonas_euryale.AAC.1
MTCLSNGQGHCLPAKLSGEGCLHSDRGIGDAGDLHCGAPPALRFEHPRARVQVAYALLLAPWRLGEAMMPWSSWPELGGCHSSRLNRLTQAQSDPVSAYL